MEQKQRLIEMGAWLKVNGEAIYGTRFAGRSAQWTEGTRPKQEYGEYMIKYNLLDQVGQVARDGMAVEQVFFTKKPGALYAISVGWPGQKLVLRGVRMPTDAGVTMLGLPGELSYRVLGDNVEITLPALGPDAAPCHYAYTFKLSGGEVLPEK